MRLLRRLRTWLDVGGGLNAARYQWHVFACAKDPDWLPEPRAWKCRTCNYRRVRLMAA